MDNKMKLRIAALKRLAEKNLDPEDYVEKLKEIKNDEVKAAMHRQRSPASSDKDDKFDEKIRSARSKMNEINNEGKSEEKLEREAYDKLYDKRLKRGALTKPFKRFKK